jgi:hypothetical protein
MVMSKSTSHKQGLHGGEVMVYCRKCHVEFKIGVIELSRLHHPATCATCIATPPAEKSHVG